MIKVCVIGHGYLGKWHCEKALKSKSAILTCIVESDPTKHSEIECKFPDVNVLDDYSKAYKLADTFIIVTPTSSHTQIIKDLMKASKNIFCEKPICENLEDARSIIKETGNYEKALMVGHSERCHLVWDQIDFSLGEYLELRREAPHKARALDVSVVDDLMIHDIDLVHFLMKDRFQSVEAFGVYKSNESPSFDYVEVLATLKSGKRVKLISDRRSITPRRSVSLHGIKCISVDLTLSNISNGEEVVSFEKRDHLFLEHENFYQAIMGTQEVLTTFKEGVDAVIVADAIKESLKIKNKVIVHYE